MADSGPSGPRSPYARPGDIDASLVAAKQGELRPKVEGKPFEARLRDVAAASTAQAKPPDQRPGVSASSSTLPQSKTSSVTESKSFEQRLGEKLGPDRSYAAIFGGKEVAGKEPLAAQQQIATALNPAPKGPAPTPPRTPLLAPPPGPVASAGVIGERRVTAQHQPSAGLGANPNRASTPPPVLAPPPGPVPSAGVIGERRVTPQQQLSAGLSANPNCASAPPPVLAPPPAPLPSAGVIGEKRVFPEQRLSPAVNPVPQRPVPQVSTPQIPKPPASKDVIRQVRQVPPNAPAPAIPTRPPAPVPSKYAVGTKGSSSQLQLGIGLNPFRRSSAPPPSGRPTLGGTRVAARLELLPDRKMEWNRIGLSAAGQLVTLGLALLSPLLFPQQMRTALKFDVVELAQPVTEIKVEPVEPETPPPPPPRAPKIKPKPKAPKVQPPELQPETQAPEPLPALNPKQPHIFLVLKPELQRARAVEAQVVDFKPALKPMEIVMTTNEPLRPKEEVKVNNSSAGSAAGTLTAAANKVQTGGFGDPNGVAGRGNPNKSANINQAGSPGLPGGPGNGNGTGGAQGLRGTIAGEGGKGSGAAAGAAAAASSGVEVQYMPNPGYSDEGRQLRMEGDVVLEVIFLASSQVQVVRVVSGLGHGLDEAAIAAAKQIRFQPAKRNGQAIDFPAHVRIRFRLSK